MKNPFELYAKIGSDKLVRARTHNDAMEIVKITSGEVSLVVGTEKFDATEGDIIFVPPTMIFSVDAKSVRAGVR